MSTIAVLDGNGDPQTIAAVDATGQAAEADCLPVVLPAAQITTLTPPAAITGFATETTLAALFAAAATDSTLAAGISALLSALGSPFQAGGSIGNSAFTANAGTNLNTSALATEATLAAASAKLPATLGSKADSASLAVTKSTEDKALTGALTETAPGTDTASSGLNGRLQRIAQNITTFFGVKVTAITALATGGSGAIGWLSQIWNELQTRLPAALGITTAANSLSIAPASDATFALTSTGYNSAIDVTRPANQTPYGAGDVVGAAIAFTSAGPTAGHVLINTADLRYDVSAIPSGMTAFRLHLYSVTPPSAYADNAVWDLPSGDRASYIGFIDLGGINDLGSTLYTAFDNIGKQVKLGASETALYGYLVTIGAYTPAANSETFRITLRTVAV